MSVEDSYPGVVIHWGGEYWAPTETNDLEPLAVMYHSLVNRENYVEEGLRLESRSLDSYFQTSMGRKVRAAGTADSYRALRMQVRKGELERGLPWRFDGKYEALCAYALTFEPQADNPGSAE